MGYKTDTQNRITLGKINNHLIGCPIMEVPMKSITNFLIHLGGFPIDDSLSEKELLEYFTMKWYQNTLKMLLHRGMNEKDSIHLVRTYRKEFIKEYERSKTMQSC